MIDKLPDVMTPSEGVDLLAQLAEQEERQETQLKATKSLRYRLETEVLVTIFDTHEMDEHTLSNGAKAKRGMKTEGSLPKVDEKAPRAEQAEQKAARQLAIDIASSYGWDEFIKSRVTGEWGKGEREAAMRAYVLLRGDNTAVVDITETIHPQTLGAQVRRRLNEGKPVDMDKLGVTVLPAVLLTKKKKG